MYSCTKCEEKYTEKEELSVHIEAEHKDIPKINIQQFNCLDCAFQGENSLQLRRHILRTQHTPCKYKEQCFTCEKVFDDYYNLMNHRREEHQSNRTCRYFLKNKLPF